MSAQAHQHAPQGCNPGVGKACRHLTTDWSGGPLPGSQPQGRDIIPHCVGPSTGLCVPGRQLPSEPASERGAPRMEAQPCCGLISGVTSSHSRGVLCSVVRRVLGPANTPREGFAQAGAVTGLSQTAGHRSRLSGTLVDMVLLYPSSSKSHLP